ncbi:MAG: hypothetical protein GY757_53005 [bacterium]|nr:hypothetical protein [bacterium]
MSKYFITILGLGLLICSNVDANSGIYTIFIEEFDKKKDLIQYVAAQEHDIRKNGRVLKRGSKFIFVCYRNNYDKSVVIARLLRKKGFKKAAVMKVDNEKLYRLRFLLEKSGKSDYDSNIENVTLLPGISQGIRLSNRDMNRFYCDGVDAKDIFFSKEKGIEAQIDGQNIFVKFLIKKDDGSYVDERAEFHVVCAPDTVYTIIAKPSNIESQTIKLGGLPDNNIAENLEIYAGLPFEKKILKLIRQTVSGKLQKSYKIIESEEIFDIFEDINMSLKRTIVIEGEGFVLRVFGIRSKEGDIRIDEKRFLIDEIGSPVGICLEERIITESHETRLIIVEHKGRT